MNTVKKLAAQGDVVFRRIKKLPENLSEQPNQGRIVVAHSETGHHHAIDSREVTFLHGPESPMVCYLQIAGEYADVVHHRTWDTHATIRLLKGTWEVRRQREHTPEGWRMVMD